MKKIIVVVCLLMLTGCNEKIYTKKPQNVDINIKNSSFEVYSDIHLSDLVDVSGAEIVDEILDTNVLGEKEYKVYYKYKKKKYVYEAKANIVDTTNPKVFGSAYKTVLLNYDKDLCDLIIFGDNYDKKAHCEIVSEYDLSTVGAYKLKYLITDSSGNENTYTITLNVVEKIDLSGTSTPSKKVDFSEFLDKYKTDNTEIGIDISRWQGNNIDFEKVKEAGATFVIMRIGVQVKALDEIGMDSCYLENIRKAKAAGLKVGVYLYTIANSPSEAISHANWVIENLDGTTLDFPIVFDWEEWGWWNRYNLSFHDINEIADAFMKTAKDSGYGGMLYSSKFYLENIWENKNNYPVWLAHYTDETSYKGDYILWQLANNGRISGIDGDVDIDILYKDKF